jgi:hypothetical protein
MEQKQAHTPISAVSDLQLKSADLAHSVTNQLTYVKDVSITSKVNTDAIANLSSIL